MISLQKVLSDVAIQRQKELTPYVHYFTGGRIKAGPFCGLMLVPVSNSDNLAPKLLGTYEDELHPWIMSCIDWNPTVVMSIGGSSGYYAMGLGYVLPASQVMSINAVGRSITIDQIANNCHNVDFLIQNLTSEDINTMIGSHVRPMIVCDYHGRELAVLNPKKAPLLKRARMIVECYNDSAQELIKRFKSSHRIEQKNQQAKNSPQFEFVKELSSIDQAALIFESRPVATTWLYLEPNQ